jgi:hypothetical protein
MKVDMHEALRSANALHAHSAPPLTDVSVTASTAQPSGGGR